MQNRSRNILLFSLTALSFLLMSWGHNGHYKINQGASQSFNSEMEQFMSWAATLAQHASDADDRKDIDPNESPRHYIDIDNYPEFIATGKIPVTYDSVLSIHGYAFVIDQGTIPWATKRCYDSLVAAFVRFDWEKAVLLASDLGHYVADGHNPLHLTRNYDGQYSNNDGIHSRYETSMINMFQSQIQISGYDIAHVADIQDYIFSYIYANYPYVDSIMAADDYARGISGNTSSSAYKQALWEKCGGFTKSLFNKASHSLAELIYSAWVDAGKPDMSSGPGIFEFFRQEDNLHLKVVPNPIREKAKVHFTNPENSEINLYVLDLKGDIIETLLNKNLPAGQHEFSIDVCDLPEGIYFLSLDAGKYRNTQKLLIINP